MICKKMTWLLMSVKNLVRNLQAIDFIKKIKNNEIDVVEHTHKVIDESKKIDKEYHYFNVISDELAVKQAELVKKNPSGKLAGLPVSVKDCICVKGVETTSGSRILKGYKPVFDATVINKIKKEGGIIIGKVSQDEFGFGAFNVNVGLDFKVPLNPFDKGCVCGGSSGGSGGITQKTGYPHISLGESTGGSIVNPASFCGVAGLCPTYGRVSRYGLLDFANSLDKIGPMGKTTSDAALMLEVISGFDENESTSLNSPVDKYLEYANKDVSGMKIGVIKEAFKGDGAVEKHVWDGIKKLESKGVKYEEISLPTGIKYGVPAYYFLSTSEASTNLAKYSGMRYGKHEKLEGGFNEYFTKVRSSNFGSEAKRRIMLGTFSRMAGYRDAYYIRAAQIRTKIIQEYKKAFKKFDALVSPTVPILPPTFKEVDKLSVLDNYMIDELTVGPNLAGMPHLSVNVGFEKKLPVGMMLIGDHLMEKKIIQLGSGVEVLK
ncbi:Asp-tRNA(Asn)/Glu-tRNA(Gln) amidotransferase GatCAB subunit A [Candidatus Woesearchaeota archaeon B3_Woes]|nr:MAG: Asp-tRNA(Asn)/Glu-tRNA(Gln) amidotransferase GatCAB subunit A [Candidatus Woesearchaeota archaeon B3_Woes]